MAADNKLRRANTERLQELVASHSDEVTVICAHDKAQYDAFAVPLTLGDGLSRRRPRTAGAGP